MLSVVIIVNGQIATVLLGVMSTSAEVGYFSISLKGAVLLSFALTAINMVTAPYITKLHYSNEKIKLQKIVTLSTRVAFIFCLFIALIFLIFGKDIISFLFGKVYVPSYLALVIISVGHLVNVACGPTGLVLNMTGFEKYSLRGVFFGLISNLLISFALIPLYGLIGASLAVMTSLIVTNIVQVISAQKKVGICTHIFCTFKSNNPYEK
jgi:O-antigen/teichoic acid export membrane protein